MSEFVFWKFLWGLAKTYWLMFISSASDFITAMITIIKVIPAWHTIIIFSLFFIYQPFLFHFNEELLKDIEIDLLLYLKSELGPLSGVPTEDLVKTFKKFCALHFTEFQLPLEYQILGHDEGIVKYILKLLNEVYYKNPCLFTELMSNRWHIVNMAHSTKAMQIGHYFWWDWTYYVPLRNIDYFFVKWFGLKGVEVENFILTLRHEPLSDNMIGKFILFCLNIFHYEGTHVVWWVIRCFIKFAQESFQLITDIWTLEELANFPTIYTFSTTNPLNCINILDYFQGFFLKYDPDFCHLSLSERLSMKIKDLNSMQLLRLKVSHYHYCLDYFSVKSNIIKDLNAFNSINESVKNIQIDIDEVQEELTKLKINNSKNRFFEDIENKF